MDFQSFWEKGYALLQSGQPIYGCWVAANTKGSPGTPASRTWIIESGESFGTIGGGIMEAKLIERARTLLQQKTSLKPTLRTLKHGTPGSEDEQSGLICGGEQQIVETILDPDEALPIIEALLRICKTDEANKVLQLSPDEGMVLKELKSPPTYQNQLFAGDDSQNWTFSINPVNQHRIAIWGGGHCGTALARLMHSLNYDVTLVESRQDLSTLDFVPPQVRIINEPHAEACGSIAFPELTLAVVMTHSLKTDVLSLEGILKHAFKLVGLMGSSRKIQQVRKQLIEMGHTEEALKKIKAPIGLPIDSDTPEEIAVSIAAQILLERNRASHG